jgi:hypothetical protein
MYNCRLGTAKELVAKRHTVRNVRAILLMILLAIVGDVLVTISLVDLIRILAGYKHPHNVQAISGPSGQTAPTSSLSD